MKLHHDTVENALTNRIKWNLIFFKQLHIVLYVQYILLYFILWFCFSISKLRVRLHTSIICLSFPGLNIMLNIILFENINHWIVYLLDVHSYAIKSEKIILYFFSELSSSSIANFLIIILGDSLIIPIAFFVSLIINSFSKTDLFRIFNYTYLKTTFSKYCEFFNYSKCVHYRVFILWNVWSIEIRIRY